MICVGISVGIRHVWILFTDSWWWEYRVRGKWWLGFGPNLCLNSQARDTPIEGDVSADYVVASCDTHRSLSDDCENAWCGARPHGMRFHARGLNPNAYGCHNVGASLEKTIETKLINSSDVMWGPRCEGGEKMIGLIKAHSKGRYCIDEKEKKGVYVHMEKPLLPSWKPNFPHKMGDDDADTERQMGQNENMAAFFLVPNMYTSAWLMKSPTVIPIVTAIMALPMSIPLPDAVIAPPSACERPDFKRKVSFQQNPPKHKQEHAARTGTKKSTPVTMTVNAVPPNVRE